MWIIYVLHVFGSVILISSAIHFFIIVQMRVVYLYTNSVQSMLDFSTNQSTFLTLQWSLWILQLVHLDSLKVVQWTVIVELFSRTRIPYACLITPAFGLGYVMCQLLVVSESNLLGYMVYINVHFPQPYMFPSSWYIAKTVMKKCEPFIRVTGRAVDNTCRKSSYLSKFYWINIKDNYVQN